MEFDLDQLRRRPLPKIIGVKGWQTVPIEPVDEPLVALGSGRPGGVLPKAIYKEGLAIEGSLGTIFVREDLAKRLAEAQKRLPEGYHLLILDGYRPLPVQKHLYETYRGALAKRHKDWSDEALDSETQKYVSVPSQDPTKPSPHSTGGAVDLMIEGLDFGTPFDHGGPATALAYFEEQAKTRSLTPHETEALENRRLLYWVMREVGLDAYEHEWWHYNAPESQMGAKTSGRKTATYGAAKLSEENLQLKAETDPVDAPPFEVLRPPLRVLVLAGGSSSEREVSLRSGANVATGLAELNYEAVMADPAESGFDLVKEAEGFDVVFLALHGAGGEDGSLQKILEDHDIPFVGSGSAASALAFDKAVYKKRLEQEDILMAKGEVVDREALKRSPLTEYPFVLKPIEGGSSIDTHIIHELNDGHKKAITETFGRYDEMLLEELIEGREITVGILGDEALPVILIKPPEGQEFDYENKYNGKTQEIVDPDEISPELKEQAQELALRIHRLIGCRHMSRTDIIISPDDRLYVLETNTIPGLTKESLLPKAAAAAGIDMMTLVKRLIDLALAS
jgi:D-alanine-D-alanine ligase